MPVIELETWIDADIYKVFDNARSIDIHMASTAQTREKAISGRTSGMIELNDVITFEAVHFGIKQRLTSKITMLDAPYHFRDEMQKGAFKSICHNHYFESQGTGTLMKDSFHYEVPYGIFGSIFDKLILNAYMTRFLIQRNDYLKRVTEQDIF